MRSGAVIVAAGMSSRMGDFKPMMKVESSHSSFSRNHCETFAV